MRRAYAATGCKAALPAASLYLHRPTPQREACHTEYISVYSQDGKLLAVLENASEIGYELKHNDLWTGSFRLPAGDPKNSYCQAHNLVRLPDDTREKGLYRIIGMPESDETGLGGWKTYSIEHVMATLLDDVLFGYHEVGGTDISTTDVIDYILNRQTVTRWQRGTVDFTDHYQYHFENVSLLSALLSLGEVLSEEYTWDFDTTTTPWTVNLRRADAEAGCGIHYGRSLVGIEKTMDASALVTRLYPLGYGEGVNQLTVRDVNNGLPYIDADTASVWGVKCSVWTDTRIEDPTLLLARARQVLEGYKNPYIAYTATALDLYRETGQSWDNYMPGKLVRVMDGEHGISFDARIVAISKSDMQGDPGAITITIANRPRDAADAINTLADRVGIGELYSQGATNLFAIPFADNADASHPAKMRVYVPSGLVRINKMLLSWQLAAFRAYSTGADSGGGSEQTSAAGGASTETTEVTETVVYTSENAGGFQFTKQLVVGASVMCSGPKSFEDGSGITQTGAAGGHSHGIGSHTHTIGAHSHGIGSHTHTMGDHLHLLQSHTHTVGNHTHTVGLKDHYHNLSGSTSQTGSVKNIDSLASKTTSSDGSGTTGGPSANAATSGIYPSPGNTGAASGTTDNSAAYDSGAATGTTDAAADHVHNMNHTHSVTVTTTIDKLEIDVAGHGHNVSIPGHSHSVSIPAHSHGIVYGIYEGGTANSVSVKVDGNTVPPSELTGNELDVSAWLEKDQDGKITRNAWHEIQIVPNSLTRIEAQLFAQCFIQSVGGGNY